MKKVFLVFVFGFMGATSAIAKAQQEVIVPFSTITVSPITQSNIPLPDLNNGGAYNVQCTMEDTTNAYNGTVVGFGTDYVLPSNGNFIYNGQSLGLIWYGYHQRPLLPGTNTLVAQQLFPSNNSLNFINTSTKDNVSVSCEAIIN